MSSSVSRRRPLLTMLFKSGISLGLIWYLALQIDFDLVGQRLTQMRLGWLGAALVLLLIQVLLATQRWRFVLQAMRISFSYRDALRAVFVGMFFNQTLPSTIGGDIVRIWALRRAQTSLDRATISVVLDRLTALCATILLIVCSLPILFSFVASLSAQLSLAGAALGCSIFLVLLLTIDMVPGVRNDWRLIRFVATLAREARRVLLVVPAAVKTLSTSVAIAIISGLCVALIAHALNIEVGILECCVLLPPILLITTLPISLAGWGVREAAMIAGFGYVDVSASDALILSVVFGLAIMLVGLPGGLVWLQKPSVRQTSSYDDSGPQRNQQAEKHQG